MEVNTSPEINEVLVFLKKMVLRYRSTYFLEIFVMLFTMYLSEISKTVTAIRITARGYFLRGELKRSFISGSRIIFNGDTNLNPPMFLKRWAKKLADFSRG